MTIGSVPEGARNLSVGGVVELVLAGIFVLLGIRSLIRWLRVEFRARSGTEVVLYALNIAARVGLWFAFAGFFAGSALVDRPERSRWYVLVPIGLAGVQLLTTLALTRGTPSGSLDSTPPDAPP